MVSLSGLPWLSHPPVKSDMDDLLSFLGSQDPEVKPSDGFDALKFSHSTSTWSNSLGAWPSSWVRVDASADGLLAVPVFECKPLFKMLEALSLWVFGHYHVARKLIGSTYLGLTVLESEIN